MAPSQTATETDDEPKTITTEIETSTGLETYELVNALVDRRETEVDLRSGDDAPQSVDAIDRLLRQLSTTTAFSVVVDDDLRAEVEVADR